MDKVKTNFVIVITVAIILCIVLMGYAASLNSQLGAEKIKTMQLNDQIAGLNTKVNDIESQLTTTTAKASDQTSRVTSLQSSLSNLQSSLDTANAELDKLKTAYANLESKLKAEVSIDVPKPAAN